MSFYDRAVVASVFSNAVIDNVVPDDFFVSILEDKFVFKQILYSFCRIFRVLVN